VVDFLNRGDAPLSQAEWTQLENIVQGAASKQLVGRRFINVIGPVGSGMQSVPNFTYAMMEPASLDMVETEEEETVAPEEREFLPMPLIYKDFMLLWRDIELNRKLGFPVEFGAAGAAASAVAIMEDRLIFEGVPELGVPGLLTHEELTPVPMGAWDEVGAIFGDAVAAMTGLIGRGFFGPFAMVLSPANFARTARLFGNSGRLESEQIREVMTAGLFFTPVLADDTAVVVSTGPQNLDLVIGQDLTVAYLQQMDLNHPFRVMESLVLRIHRPGAITVLGGGAAPSGRGRRGRRAAEETAAEEKGTARRQNK
jgi:uncharacterized linocin/CFP29 family protein